MPAPPGAPAPTGAGAPPAGGAPTPAEGPPPPPSEGPPSPPSEGPPPPPSEGPPPPPSEGPPPPPSEGRAALERRAALAVAVLVARTVAQQIAILGGNVWLARLLDPADFGLFAIVQFALNVFAAVGDVGLGAALVQRKAVATHRELSSIFWTQILLALGVVAAVAAAAPALPRVWPKLTPGSEWLLRALAFQLLLTAARAVPSLMLERELRFGRLAVIDFAMTVAFYATAVPLAARGLGTFALVYAVLAQGLVANALMAVFRPFRPALALDVALVRPFVRFGLLFQTKNLLSMVNEWVIPVVAGGMLGPAAVGLHNWARQTAYFPLTFTGIVCRVAFPLLSRLRDDPDAFARTLGRAVHLCGIVTLFFSGLFVGLGAPLTRVVFGEKWLPALPVLTLYALVHTVGFLSPVFAAAFDGLGRPGVTVRLMAGWTTFNWLAAPLAVLLERTPFGFAVGACLHTVLGNPLTVYVYRRVGPPGNPVARLWSCFAAGALSAALGRALLAPNVRGPASLVAAVAAHLVVYFAALLAIDPRARAEVRALARTRQLFGAEPDAARAAPH
ncbi:MAG TPA: oligosaccharide flippase family protein [Polyangiaceae bacterium]|nr:oligosaccharide flippase family protein [Polyangiaceae bacterium]